jgi:hypothetical protein
VEPSNASYASILAFHCRLPLASVDYVKTRIGRKSWEVRRQDWKLGWKVGRQFTRAGPKPGKEERVGPKPGKEERVGPKPGKEERVGPKPGKEERVGPKPGKEERVGMYLDVVRQGGGGNLIRITYPRVCPVCHYSYGSKQRTIKEPTITTAHTYIFFIVCIIVLLC